MINRTLIACLLAVATQYALASTPDRFSSEHFEYVAYDVPAATLWEIKVHLEKEYPTILQTFGLSELPQTRIRVFSSVREFEEAKHSAQTIVAPEPRGYLVDEAGTPTIALLYADQEDLTEAIHQFVHVATLAVNPDLERSARWLWESVASYQAKQFIPPMQMSCVTLSEVPSLGRLNVPDNHDILRRVGYLLGDFIGAEYGDLAMQKLVAANGNIQPTLGVSDQQFERSWHAFTANTYLARNQTPPILSTIRLNREVIGNTFYFEDGRHLYLAANHNLFIGRGELVQTGNWSVRGGTDVCWQILNFNEFCATFRMNNDQFWLDTASDCKRYSLRRAVGNIESH